MDEPVERWQWPAPPFDWRHVPPPGLEIAQACRIETATGTTVDGTMISIDPGAGRMVFRTGADGPPLTLPFARFRRLTLTAPLKSIDTPAGRAPELVPASLHERAYRLIPTGGGDAVSGRTTGHVETPEGLFLFEPIDERSLRRVLVPRSAYNRCEFGSSAQDSASEHWIASPTELLDAIERQQRMPVLPIGQSLLDLGLVTQAQLDRALADPQGQVLPLGERLVTSGVISAADLHTAIAHKMGYPLVNLTRFPIEPTAARKLPLQLAVKHRALPIMLDKDRLIVAVDRPQRAVDLQGLYALATLKVVPVLASKGKILLALSTLLDQDMWSETVAIRPQFFAATQ